MLRFIAKKAHLWYLLNQSKDCLSDETTKEYMTNNYKDNIEKFKRVFGDSSDITFREFYVDIKKQIACTIVFNSNLTDKKIINQNIIKPLMDYNKKSIPPNIEYIEFIKKSILTVNSIEKSTTIDKLIDCCLLGDTIIIINGAKEALIASTREYTTRSLDEPKTESVVRGAHVGFTEDLGANMSLMRRIMINPDLIMEIIRIGTRTRTQVCIAHIKGIANPKVVDEVKRRLNRIKIDAILESGYIEQFIEDAPFSIFSTVANSEKPDAVIAKLLEGRVAILVDGTPIVLTVPMIFLESFQSSEDYYSRPFYVSLIRILRTISYGINILGPALYVALSTFHQELIPTPLLFTMASAHEGVPFPSSIEVGIMIIVYEILREAGVRLPRPIGQSVSIVGALVIGEAAVSAGIIGAPVVIVISLTAVASFVVPTHTASGVILRFIFLILASFVGGYGIFIGIVGLVIHLTSLRSFGVPYLSPIAPLILSDMKDSIIRLPIWAMITRPKTFVWNDQKRQDFSLKTNKTMYEEKESQDSND